MSLTLFRGQLPPGGSSVPDPDFSATQTKDNSQLDAIKNRSPHSQSGVPAEPLVRMIPSTKWE